MSLSVTMLLAVILPTKVLAVLFSFSSFGTNPFGIADLLAQQPEVPESIRNRNSFLLRTHPIELPCKSQRAFGLQEVP